MEATSRRAGYAASALVSSALLAGVLLTRCSSPEGKAPAARIDHVILGINDLERGMQLFEQATGATAPFGGEHPGVGTHNALAELGDGVYLEIIAPRPAAELSERWGRLRGFEELTPTGWAIGVDDLELTLAALHEAGFETTAPAPGSRATPDGLLLEWRTAGIIQPEMTPAPFLIEWGKNSAHPSETSPPGCRLAALAIVSPAPEAPARLVDELGLPVRVEQGPEWSMTLAMDCPNGRKTFGGTN